MKVFNLKYPKTWIALLATTVVLLAAAVLFVLLFQPFAPTDERKTAPVVTQQVHPDSLSKLRQAFGPWRIVTTPRSDEIVMLMQNGSEEQGSKTVRLDKTWQPAAVTEFRDVVREGNIMHVRSTSDAIYAIRVGQPFVLEARPETVYVFATSSTVVAVFSARLDEKVK